MEVNRATISSGSVGTFRSHTTLPVSSTTHTAVSFTETSRPTKYVIAIAPSSLLEVTVTPIWSSHVGGAALNIFSDAAAAIHHLVAVAHPKAAVPLSARPGLEPNVRSRRIPARKRTGRK